MPTFRSVPVPAFRLWTALVLSFLLISASPALADAPSIGDQAKKALAAGDAKLAISLLSPPPISGAHTCVLAEALLLENQSARAMLYLERCRKAGSTSGLRRKLTELKKRLRAEKFAPVALALQPTHARAKVDHGYDPGDALLHDEDVWLPQGDYRIELSADGFEAAAFALVVDSPDRMLLPLSLEKAKETKTQEIDMVEEAGSEVGAVTTAADPRPKKFKGLLPKKYKIAPDPKLVARRDSASSPWPWLATAGGTAAIGAGIAFHLGDNTLGAAIGYGSGAGLLATAAYLFLRGENKSAPDASRISLTPSSGGLGWAVSGRW